MINDVNLKNIIDITPEGKVIVYGTRGTKITTDTNAVNLLKQIKRLNLIMYSSIKMV